MPHFMIPVHWKTEYYFSKEVPRHSLRHNTYFYTKQGSSYSSIIYRSQTKSQNHTAFRIKIWFVPFFFVHQFYKHGWVCHIAQFALAIKHLNSAILIYTHIPAMSSNIKNQQYIYHGTTTRFLKLSRNCSQVIIQHDPCKEHST